MEEEEKKKNHLRTSKREGLGLPCIKEEEQDEEHI